MDGNSNESNNIEVTVPCNLVPVPVSDTDPVLSTNPKSLIPVATEPRNEDKRFKVKNRNKSKKEGDKKVEKLIKADLKVSLCELFSTPYLLALTLQT